MWSIVGSGANQEGGGSSTVTLTHGLTINADDLCVAYINFNSGTSSCDFDSSAGADWNEAIQETPAGKTAQHVYYWKAANGSEPAAWTWTLGSSEVWGAVFYVFRGSGAPAINADIVTAITAGFVADAVCEAPNGEIVADGAISVVFGGKDTRTGGGAMIDADNSYIGAIGHTAGQYTAGAYRIFATGETISFDVTINGPDAAQNCFSAHMSFVEDVGEEAADILPASYAHQQVWR